MATGHVRTSEAPPPPAPAPLLMPPGAPVPASAYSVVVPAGRATVAVTDAPFPPANPLNEPPGAPTAVTRTAVTPAGTV